MTHAERGDAINYFCLRLQRQMGSIPEGMQAVGADPQQGGRAVAMHSGLGRPDVSVLMKANPSAQKADSGFAGVLSSPGLCGVPRPQEVGTVVLVDDPFLPVCSV